MSYAGCDTSAFPGPVAMQAMRDSTNLTWCGFYLAPAPSHPGRDWMGSYAALRSMGWGLAPIYVGQQQDGPGSQDLSADRGRADALDAIGLLANAGFPQGSRLFLDIETGNPPTAGMSNYYAAWVQGVINENCLPGVYCSYRVAPLLMAIDPRPTVWVWHLGTVADPGASPYPTVEPDQSGYPGAALWQWAQNTSVPVGSLTISPIDLSVSSVADPSVP